MKTEIGFHLYNVGNEDRPSEKCHSIVLGWSSPRLAPNDMASLRATVEMKTRARSTPVPDVVESFSERVSAADRLYPMWSNDAPQKAHLLF